MSEQLRYRLQVTLEGVEPLIWRELEVSADIPLPELHSVLQILMGWQDYHLHLFEGRGGTFGDPDSELEMEDEREFKLRDLVFEAGSTLVYEYDFGDSWRHRIELVGIRPGGPGSARCLAGGRSAPPEDCGGPPGYQQLLEAIADPVHPEHEELAGWAGDFDPERFDLRSVNRLLEIHAPGSRGVGRQAEAGQYLPLGSRELARCDHWCEEDLLAVWSARSRASLLRALLPNGPIGSSSHHWEMPALIRHHRSRGGETAELALLVLTCSRWESCTARAVQEVAGLLSEPNVDLLCAALLTPGYLELRYPLGSTSLSPKRGGLRFLSPDPSQPDIVVGRDAPFPIRRRVAPPLRRFAVAMALRRGLLPTGLTSAMELSLALRRRTKGRADEQGAAAVVAGSLDAFEALPEDDRSRLLDIGLGYPRSQVRKLALKILEARAGRQAMLARARVDPDASIRRLARSLELDPGLPF